LVLDVEIIGTAKDINLKAVAGGAIRIEKNLF
jgi:hypothetical protein